MKVYIAGKITGEKDFLRKFIFAAGELYKLGHMPMHSAGLPQGFDYDDYLHICYAMIDTCDMLCLLPDWVSSNGAQLERKYASEKGKQIRLYRDILND